MTPSASLLDLDQVVGDLLAEEGGDAVADVVDRRQVVHQPAVVREREMDVRMGERDPREGFGRVAHLGLRRAEELVPDRRVEEQVADFDRRADGAADGRDGCATARRRLPARRRSQRRRCGCGGSAG